MSTYKFVLSALFSFILLSAQGQKDTLSIKKDTMPKKEIKVKKDTTAIFVDSLPPKDTIFIKYIPVLPSSYLKADAWYFQKLNAKTTAYKR